MLLSHGANVNCDGYLGMSPLLIACKNGNLDILLVLLKHNADPHHIDKNGDNSLILACRSGNIHVIKVLVGLLVNIHHRNPFGETPLSISEKLQKLQRFYWGNEFIKTYDSPQ